jgi:hypothetical protein
MNNVCTAQGSIVSKRRIFVPAEFHPQRRTADTQLFRPEISMQCTGGKDEFELSRIQRGFIYYYYI